MQKNDSLAAWKVVLTASLFFFYAFIQLNLFNAITAPLMEAYQLNAAQLGQFASMFFYANALCLFPAGMMLDRYSTKKLLLFASLCATVGTFVFSAAHSYWLAASGRFLVGVGASFCFLSCVRLASRWFPPSRMALVTGLVVTMAMLGGLVAQTPFALLSNAVGWRQAVMLDGILGIVITLAIFYVVQDCPPSNQTDAAAAKAHLQQLGFWRSIKLVVLNPQNWLGGVYTSLLNLPVFLLGALWGIPYLVQVHHVTELQASFATTVFFLGVIFGSPFFGWLSDHMMRRVLPMVIGAVCSLVVILLLMYLPDLTLFALIILFFAIGFFTSSQVLSYPTIVELNPTALTGTAVSIASATIMCSGVVFQPLFGWLMQLVWNHQVTNGVPVYSVSDFNHAMLIFPVAFVVGLFITFFIRETHCQPTV